MTIFPRLLRIAIGSLVAALLLAGCSGGDEGNGNAGGGDNKKFAVGGTVTGLMHGSLTLTLNGDTANSQVVEGDGSDKSFDFGEVLLSTTIYRVEFNDPENHQCVVTSGNDTGTIEAADIFIDIECEQNRFSIGGSVTGLESDATVSLTLNDGSPLTVSGDDFTLGTDQFFDDETDYEVTLSAEPDNRSCVILSATGSNTQITDNGKTVTGTIDGADISISIECQPFFTISVEVEGLIAGSLEVGLNNDRTLTFNSDDLVEPKPFSKKLVAGDAYEVTIGTPSNNLLECTFDENSVTSGVVSDQNIVVNIECVQARFIIRGTISGLVTSALKLKLNDTEEILVNGGDQFFFSDAINDHSEYIVTISQQAHHQLCSIENGGGTLNGAAPQDIEVTCHSWQTADGQVKVVEAAENATLLSHMDLALNNETGLLVYGHRNKDSDTTTFEALQYFPNSATEWVQSTIKEAVATQAVDSARTALNDNNVAVSLFEHSTSSKNPTLSSFVSTPNIASWSETESTLLSDASGYKNPEVVIDQAGNALLTVNMAVDGESTLRTKYRYYSVEDGKWSDPAGLNNANTSNAKLAMTDSGFAIALFQQKNASDGRQLLRSKVFSPETKQWSETPLVVNNNGNASQHQIAINNKGEAVAVYKRGDKTIAARTYDLRAKGTISITDNTQITDDSFSIGEDTFTAGVDFAVGTAPFLTAKNLFDAIIAAANPAYKVTPPNIVVGNGVTITIQATGLGEVGSSITLSYTDSGNGVAAEVSGDTLALSNNWSDEILINDLEEQADTPVERPLVAVDDQGRTLVVWEEHPDNASPILKARTSQSLSNWGAIGHKVLQDSGIYSSIALTMNNKGQALLVWSAAIEHTFRLYARVYAPDDGGWTVSESTPPRYTKQLPEGTLVNTAIKAAINNQGQALAATLQIYNAGTEDETKDIHLFPFK